MEYWSIGLIISICCIAFCYNQVIDPISSGPFTFQAFKQVKKAIFKLIRSSVKIFEFFFHYSSTPILHNSTTPTLHYSGSCQFR